MILEPDVGKIFLFEVVLINDINVHGGVVHNEVNIKIFLDKLCISTGLGLSGHLYSNGDSFIILQVKQYLASEKNDECYNQLNTEEILCISEQKSLISP